MFRIGDVVRLKGSGPLSQAMVVYKTVAEATILDRIGGLTPGYVKVQWKGPLGMFHWDVVAEATLELVPGRPPVGDANPTFP